MTWLSAHMKTRVELENSFYKENQLVLRILEALSCTNIRTCMVDLGSDQRIICSFDKTENSPYALLGMITDVIKPRNVYQSNNHFSMSFSLSQLKEKVDSCCRNLFYDVINTWGSYCAARRGLVYSHFGSELHLTSESYDILRSQKCVKEWYSLINVGVGILERNEIVHDLLTETFSSNTIYYIGINDIELIFKNTVIKEIIEKLKNEKLTEDHKVALLMAGHSRLGSESTIKNNLFDNKKLFDRNLVREVFSFFVSVKSAPIAYPHKIIGDNELYSYLSSDEKTNEPILLEKVRQRSHKLKKEIDSDLPRPNIDIKIKKCQFLELVQVFHDLNPTLTLKSCVECVRQEDPLLFDAAMSGSLSHATKTLIDEILNLPQAGRCLIM